MNRSRLTWVRFTLSFCNVIAAYAIIPDAPADANMKVKLVTHVPRGYYYSLLNDACSEAVEHYEQSKLKPC